MGVIAITVDKNDVAIHIEDDESTLFVNDTASSISNQITSQHHFSPIVLSSAFDAAYDSSRSGSAVDTTSIFVRNEAVLELMQSFTKDIRSVLHLPEADETLTKNLKRLRRELCSTINSKYNPELTNEIIEFSKNWLDKEKSLFLALKERLDTLPTLKFTKDTLLRTEDIYKDETLLMLANTLADCPELATEPHFTGSRLLGACARNLKGYAKTFTLMELFSLRIDEVRRYSEGKSISLGKLIAKPLESGLAVSLIESAQGLVITFVRSRDKNVPWSQSIIPTHWHFQTRSVVSDLIREIISLHPGDPQGMKSDIELIAAAFAPHMPISVTINL